MDLILFRGRPGVGKTALSTRLSARITAPVIRKDDIYDPVAAFHDSHEMRNRMAYGVLYRMLGSNRDWQGRWILDFPFNREEDMLRFGDWLRERGIGWKSILCVCSDEALWAARFSVRKENPQPNQLITDFDALKRHYGDLSISPMEGELVVDTVEPLETLLDKIAEYVDV